MILSKDEVNFYNDKGYLLVEDVITEDQHNEMLALVKDFFERSKNVKTMIIFLILKMDIAQLIPD